MSKVKFNKDFVEAIDKYFEVTHVGDNKVLAKFNDETKIKFYKQTKVNYESKTVGGKTLADGRTPKDCARKTLTKLKSRCQKIVKEAERKLKRAKSNKPENE